MTTERKLERAARWAAYSAAYASWQRSAARTELAAAMQLATVRVYERETESGAA